MKAARPRLNVTSCQRAWDESRSRTLPLIGTTTAATSATITAPRRVSFFRDAVEMSLAAQQQLAADGGRGGSEAVVELV